MFDAHRWLPGISHTAAFAFFAILGPPLLHASDISSYRGLKMGMSMEAAALVVGARPADASVVHQRPAMIQDLAWRLRLPAMSDSVAQDPLKSGLLSFYNGELFRIEATYDSYRVEGMTADDMIEGISATYGAATHPAAEIAYHSNYGDTAKVIARWEDADYSCNLVRTGDQSSFVLVLYSKRVSAAAQAAGVEALRLDKQEAPQREMDKQKLRDEEKRQLLEKARALNKPNFRA